MKKKLILFILIMICAGMTGCIVDELPLNDEEMEIVAQYAADAMLRRDKHYQDMLLTPEQMTPPPTRIPGVTATKPAEEPEETATPTPTATPTLKPEEGAETPEPTEKPLPTEKPTPTPFAENTEYTNDELTSVIGAWDGLYAEYIGASSPVKEFSMGDSATALKPEAGFEYIIVKFTITNNNDEVSYLSTYQQDLKCILMYNHGETKNAELTMFTNDLRFIGTPDNKEEWSFGQEIGPNKTYDAVLVFKLPEGTELESAGIAITNSASEAVIIKIK